MSKGPRRGVTAALAAAVTFGLVGVLPAQPALSSVAPLHFLFNVSCLSAANCMAVGQTAAALKGVTGTYSILAERWDGARWSVVPSQTPPGPLIVASLHAVSCVSATFCMAVGLYSEIGPDGPANEGLVETWDGHAWRIVDGPASAAALLDVRCLNSTDCNVVGDSTPVTGAKAGDVYDALAAGWDGANWAQQPITGIELKDTAITSIACARDRLCLALGATQVNTPSGGQEPVALRLTSGRWVALAAPPAAPPIEHPALSCSTLGLCMAAGVTSAHVPAIERWDGRGWSSVAAPRTPTGQVLSLDVVSCYSKAGCTAVGQSVGATRGTVRNQAASWNGHNWSVVPMVTPARTNQSELTGLACISAQYCEAVGWAQPNPTAADHLPSSVPEVETWNGTSWTSQATP